jgi:hypothetical protein
MTTETIQLLVQAGMGGIALVLIFLLWQIIKRQDAQTAVILQVVRENAAAMTSLNGGVSGLKDVIASLCTSNERLQGQVTQQLQAQMAAFQADLQRMRGGDK